MKTGPCAPQMKKPDGSSDAVDWHHSSAAIFTGGMLAYSDKRGDDNVAPASSESLDWYVAKQWNTTPLHFNPLARPGDAPRKNGDRISWKKQPDGSITFHQEHLNALSAWNEVFKNLPAVGNGPSPEQLLRDKRSAVDKSILDQTRADTLALNKVLSTSQRQALDAHESALRDLEKRLAATATAPTVSCIRPRAAADAARYKRYPSRGLKGASRTFKISSWPSCVAGCVQSSVFILPT